MKYLLIVILFILSLGYAGYYMYMFDKRDRTNEPVGTGVQEHLTKKFWRNVTPEQLKEKLKNIKDINEIRPDTQETMFALLIKHGQYPEMIDILISAGVDYNLKIKEAYEKIRVTALHLTVIRTEKPYEFTKVLLKYDQNIDEPDEVFGGSPLQWALFYRAPTEVIELLLSMGANPNFQSKYKHTPLISACPPNRYIGVSFINPKVIQLLLDHKADITIKSLDEGKTAYDYMKENEEFAKTELFKKISIQLQKKF